MTAEIKVNYSISATKGALRMSPPNKVLVVDMAGTHWSGGVQDIGTTQEQIVFGSDMASIGWTELVNLDSTNYVEIGQLVSGTFYPIIKLLPGESCPVRLATLTLYARANTATVKLGFTALEA